MNERTEVASAAKGRRKAGYHHNDLRNAVLAEAIVLVATRNGPHFSLREVGAALGVTHSSVYRHFADKDALLDALTVEAFRTLHQYQQDEIAHSPATPASRLRALCLAYVRFAQEQLGFFRLLFDNRPETEASRRGDFDGAAYQMLVDTIRDCQEDGTLLPGDPRRLAGYLLLAPHGLAHYQSQPRAPGLASKGPLPLMSVEDLADLALVPLLRSPPSPDQIAARFFGDPEASPKP